MRRSRRSQPPGGTFDSAQSVSVEVPEGCTATYTTDGTVPLEGSSRYNGPITVSKTTVLRVRAFMSGYMRQRHRQPDVCDLHRRKHD